MQFFEEMGQDGKFCGYTGVMKSLVPIQYREHNIEGVLNHEIGTHFLRKSNQELQVWDGKYNRFEYKLSQGMEKIATEEGLASLNQILP